MEALWLEPSLARQLQEDGLGLEVAGNALNGDLLLFVASSHNVSKDQGLVGCSGVCGWDQGLDLGRCKDSVSCCKQGSC